MVTWGESCICHANVTWVPDDILYHILVTIDECTVQVFKKITYCTWLYLFFDQSVHGYMGFKKNEPWCVLYNTSSRVFSSGWPPDRIYDIGYRIHVCGMHVTCRLQQHTYNKILYVIYSAIVTPDDAEKETAELQKSCSSTPGLHLQQWQVPSDRQTALQQSK